MPFMEELLKNFLLGRKEALMLISSLLYTRGPNSLDGAGAEPMVYWAKKQAILRDKSKRRRGLGPGSGTH
ncbi:hypothetical protein A4R35_12210 [Thermogemmatispora tikiterensis]|uniref:Uncharacterized protein n=1 Tax=Thermogemmatispora tikiterensis TaxID=1825093 RepID=A0A328VKH3_9CHLR|nr:hypothetical protein A4R35_12210 [Thermogemmatispora tikiterensis]